MSYTKNTLLLITGDTMKIFFYHLIFIALLNNIANAATKNNELRVAIFIEPPFVAVVDGNLIGESIDIAKLLAKTINLRASIIRCPFARCSNMVEKGQADMIMGIKKTPKREENLMFIEPASLSQHLPLRFFTLSPEGLTINSLHDLEAITVGVLRGSVYFNDFDENTKIEKIAITSRKQLVHMLLKGYIDTFIDREESIIPLLPEHIYQQKISLADYQYNQPVKGYVAISKKSHVSAYAIQLTEYLTTITNNGVISSIKASNRNKLTGPLPQ